MGSAVEMKGSPSPEVKNSALSYVSSNKINFTSHFEDLSRRKMEGGGACIFPPMLLNALPKGFSAALASNASSPSSPASNAHTLRQSRSESRCSSEDAHDAPSAAGSLGKSGSPSSSSAAGTGTLLPNAGGEGGKPCRDASEAAEIVAGGDDLLLESTLGSPLHATVGCFLSRKSFERSSGSGCSKGAPHIKTEHDVGLGLGSGSGSESPGEECLYLKPIMRDTSRRLPKHIDVGGDNLVPGHFDMSPGSNFGPGSRFGPGSKPGPWSPSSASTFSPGASSSYSSSSTLSTPTSSGSASGSGSESASDEPALFGPGSYGGSKSANIRNNLAGGGEGASDSSNSSVICKRIEAKEKKEKGEEEEEAVLGGSDDSKDSLRSLWESMMDDPAFHTDYSIVFEDAKANRAKGLGAPIVPSYAKIYKDDSPQKEVQLYVPPVEVPGPPKKILSIAKRQQDPVAAPSVRPTVLKETTKPVRKPKGGLLSWFGCASSPVVM
eukprot:jgi/Mesen1/9728/ME000695S09044